MDDCMDKRTAINLLDSLLGMVEDNQGNDYDTALKMGIEALKADVQCKYCKHSTEWYRDKRRCFLWCEDGIDVFEDGYCNYWERKDGEQGAEK